MKTKFYPYSLVFVMVCFQLLLSQLSMAQTCDSLIISYVSTESRCAATGSIQINASGGSGSFLYKVSGPVSTNFSTDSIITGLPAGTYLAVIKDLNTGCVYQNDSVTVAGDYNDPRFLMSKTDVTCINGSDGSITVYNQEFGRGPFMYTIVAPSASNVGLQSATGVFTGLLHGNYMVQLTDSCGGIQNRSMTIVNYDWWIASYSGTRICDSAAITISLEDSRGSISPDPVFNSFTYGYVKPTGDTAWFSTPSFTCFIGNKTSLKLLVKDQCGNIKMVTWNNPYHVPDVNISISNKACSTFTVKATVVGFTPVEFCLHTKTDIPIACNTTGEFTNLPYGNYCISTRGICPDTTITRCFTVSRPEPSVDPKVSITDMSCTDFTVTITGSSNLTNPNFCLYNSANVLITCNTTGIFKSLPYGKYCITITNDPACFDTTITRCFSAEQPVPAIDKVLLSNFTCKTFRATVQTANGGAGWSNPMFCLYDAAHVLITCNTTGIFDSLLYGNYCITVANDPNPKFGCMDTTLEICFTAHPPKPSVAAAVKITASCNAFTAEITDAKNLNNPQFCLYDTAGVQLACNTTGKFASLGYGSYCIKVFNDSTCYDTVITRCFTQLPLRLAMALSADRSCSAFGKTDIRVNISSGYASYIVKVLNPANQVVSLTTVPGSTTIYGLPGLPAAQQYTVVVTDKCGNTDTLLVTPVLSYLTKTIAVTRKCPSGVNPDGTADIQVTATSNLGTATPRIIKKNSSLFTSDYDYHSGSLFVFYDLPPATYIIEYSYSGCSLKAWDTIAVPKYIYPDLSRSSAYNCDSNTISVGAVATGGITPFMYEIFQSVPALPSIVTPPQASPLFTFNNSTNYSLIRLRAIDACGNASINDVSILPMAPVVIIPPAGIYCLYQAITLRVDTIANATYQWYHKLSATDSVLVSSTDSYAIPVLSPSDTGDYVCVVSVNNYCLNRLAQYHVGGNCGNILPVDVQLKGYAGTDGAANLSWEPTSPLQVKEYVVERGSDKNGNYLPIAKQLPNQTGMAYVFKDASRLGTVNYYRIKIITAGGAVKYSNAVMIKNKNAGDAGISIYPNPVQQDLNISFNSTTKNNYTVTVITAAGKKVHESTWLQMQNEYISIRRNNNMANGFYIVVITNLKTGQQSNYKVLFQ